MHYCCQIQAVLLVTTISSVLLMYDLYMAQHGLTAVAPEAEALNYLTYYRYLAMTASALGMIPAGCSCIFGLEACSSIRQSKLSLAFGRSVKDIFGLVPRFALPLALCLALSLHLTMKGTDPHLYPETWNFRTVSTSAFHSVDYFFGQQAPMSEFKMIPTSWLASVLHFLYLVVFALIMTNLFIAIIGDAWEESVMDAHSWMVFSRASFAAAIYSEQEEKAWPAMLVVVRQLSETGKVMDSPDDWIGRVNSIRNAVKEDVNGSVDGVERRMAAMEDELTEVKVLLRQVLSRLEDN